MEVRKMSVNEVYSYCEMLKENNRKLENRIRSLIKDNQKLKEEIAKLQEKEPVTIYPEPKTLSKKESKKKYGEYQNVRLTDKEFDSLIQCYGQEVTGQLIIYLDEYIEMKGYKAKSHYLCMKKWVVDAINNTRYPKPKKEMVPEWFDKKVEGKKASPEEIARMKEMLKDYS